MDISISILPRFMITRWRPLTSFSRVIVSSSIHHVSLHVCGNLRERGSTIDRTGAILVFKVHRTFMCSSIHHDSRLNSNSEISARLNRREYDPVLCRVLSACLLVSFTHKMRPTYSLSLSLCRRCPDKVVPFVYQNTHARRITFIILFHRTFTTCIMEQT